jgi:hypothetical protein
MIGNRSAVRDHSLLAVARAYRNRGTRVVDGAAVRPYQIL